MPPRKAKQAKDTQRRGQASKSAGQTVLIVCEGTKTELNYFKELRQHYHLQAVHTVDVTPGSSGRNAKNILLDAKKRYKVSKEKGDPYDYVYCVFDRDDEHGANAGFRDVVSEIRKTKDFYAAYSIPSLSFGYCCILLIRANVLKTRSRFSINYKSIIKLTRKTTQVYLGN